MAEDHELYVNEERTVLVRVWPDVDGRPLAEVATRPEPGATWGPPVYCRPED